MRIARASGVALAALVFWGRPGAGQVKPALPLDVLETQVQSDSNNPEIHYQLGLGYWARRRWDDAEPDLRAGWERYQHRGEQPSAWEEIKEAVRDAWNRVTGARTGESEADRPQIRE